MKKSMWLPSIGLAVSLVGGAIHTAHAEDSMITSVKRLSMETALTIAQATLEACRAEGIQVGVTVVDRDGIPQVKLRDTIAPTITLPISEGKAYAAVMFSVATSQLADRSNTPIGRVPGIIMSAGAVPITSAGSMLGAVGVSGAPAGETDEMCAIKGVEAVQDDLEMAL